MIHKVKNRLTFLMNFIIFDGFQLLLNGFKIVNWNWTDLNWFRCDDSDSNHEFESKKLIRSQFKSKFCSRLIQLPKLRRTVCRNYPINNTLMLVKITVYQNYGHFWFKKLLFTSLYSYKNFNCNFINVNLIKNGSITWQ